MLIHLIYCSEAIRDFSSRNLSALLRVARQSNGKKSITGMLLYAERSFFQVLEGEENDVLSLFDVIQKDRRHRNLTVIVQEPIAERSFGDWTMGYADISPDDVRSITGTSNFLVDDWSAPADSKSRAMKLLMAFKQGHWRARVTGADDVAEFEPVAGGENPEFKPAVAGKPVRSDTYSFAFQAIGDVRTKSVFSYEALLRGRNGESAQQVLNSVDPKDICLLDEESRLVAISLAAGLGLNTRLNLNIIPSTAISSPSTIPSILECAEENGILPDQIVLEVLESEMINDLLLFRDAIRQHRGTGVRFAIDDFGAGYAGLNLLSEFQPHMIKLDMHLVRDIDRKGPRQAIVRGLLQTCRELGIDIIAEGVESEQEYEWLCSEGVVLFQGYLFAEPRFENLSPIFNLPD